MGTKRQILSTIAKQLLAEAGHEGLETTLPFDLGFAVTNEPLAENPQAFDNQLLLRFAEFKDFRERSRASTGQAVKPEPLPLSVQETPKQAPEERIDTAFEELSAALRTELLDRIRAASPTFFEHLIADEPDRAICQASSLPPCPLPTIRTSNRSG